ncbi:MAG: alpha-amylase family glycosyl hydrolase [Roseiflexaceae bacterium]|nr:alpha-amylase family glycosyl hydrolase [Roseiflexaceae bacterium]
MKTSTLALSLSILLLITSCSAPSPAVPPTTAPSAAPSATPLSDEAALLATIAANAPSPADATPTVPLPTPFPTITLGPTAEPRPLPEGWWDTAVCYEIFVRSFYDSNGDGIGDLNGLIAKLDYVNDGDPTGGSDLGATCIWLMPVAEAASYHGYDVIDYYAIEKDYGTNDDFKRLVEEANRRGIRVIVDLVLNHTSSAHPWFISALNDPASPYRDWYIWSPVDPGYRGPWGQQVWHRSPARNEYYYGVFVAEMPDLNYRNPAVVAEAEKIAAFWLNEMGVDGFRLDAIKHVVENGSEQEGTRETHAWMRAFEAAIERIKPGTFTVGEVFGGRAGSLAAYYPDQLDTYFEFGVAEGILRSANTGAPGPYLTAVEEALTRLPYQRWAPFLTNHDQERVMTVLGGDVGKARVAATALLTLPGLPFVYYGEEIGMSGAKPDERIRTPMQWTGEPGAGFTTGSPWQAPQSDFPTVNVAAQNADPGSLLNVYRTLIRLHTTRPALGEGDFTALNATRGAAAFLRCSGDDAVMVIINFSASPLSGVTLSTARSSLIPGVYTPDLLFGSGNLPPLTAGADGSISAYALPEIPPQSALIVGLGR